MLKLLKLENFRSHKNFEIELDQITAIIGRNGVGKSNILEAVSVLSLCRSFRDDEKKNLVHYDADYSRVTGDSMEVFIQKNPRLLVQAKNGGLARKQSDFIGTLRSIIFSPETLSIITGAPKQRRKFLDIMISQKDREYLCALMNYEKVRIERNSLLQLISDKKATVKELDFWNQELVRNGEVVLSKRKLAVSFLNKKIFQYYQKISGKDDAFKIDHEETVRADFLAELNNSLVREIATRRTLIGPHRDDLNFKLSSCNMANFASRGEIRSAVLSLKFAELEYLTEEGGTPPILLLDDVFSEFDEQRRSHLGEIIMNYQTIIATTDRGHLSKDLLQKSKVVELK